MTQGDFQHKGVIFKNTAMQAVVFVAMIVLLSNLNAIVDHFLHPEIPYLDEEHLLVGGATGLVSSMLVGAILLYTRYLERALSTIHELEAFLPICASCKKIRVKDEKNPGQVIWQPVEKYIAGHSNFKLTHSLCPECLRKLYPDDVDDVNLAY